MDKFPCRVFGLSSAAKKLPASRSFATRSLQPGSQFFQSDLSLGDPGIKLNPPAMGSLSEKIPLSQVWHGRRKFYGVCGEDFSRGTAWLCHGEGHILMTTEFFMPSYFRLADDYSWVIYFNATSLTLTQPWLLIFAPHRRVSCHELWNQKTRSR